MSPRPKRRVSRAFLNPLVNDRIVSRPPNSWPPNSTTWFPTDYDYRVALMVLRAGKDAALSIDDIFWIRRELRSRLIEEMAAAMR